MRRRNQERHIHCHLIPDIGAYGQEFSSSQCILLDCIFVEVLILAQTFLSDSLLSLSVHTCEHGSTIPCDPGLYFGLVADVLVLDDN